VRIAAFIVIIASFVVTVELLLQAYVYTLYEALGIFIPLIVVNCIILGRAEAFASKRSIPESIMDGLGIGLGFTLSLGFLGAVREIIGGGTIFGVHIFWESFQPMGFFLKPAGAFVTLGLVLALINIISQRKA
jgi:electron transport complex protein RnfE